MGRSDGYFHLDDTSERNGSLTFNQSDEFRVDDETNRVRQGFGRDDARFDEGLGKGGLGSGGIERVGLDDGDGLESSSLSEDLVGVNGRDESGGGRVEEVVELVGESGESGSSSDENDLMQDPSK